VQRKIVALFIYCICKPKKPINSLDSSRYVVDRC
jgi:hypothetical protein